MQAGHRDAGGVSADPDRVLAVRAVDDDLIDLAVAARAAERPCEVGDQAGDVGSAQVVDGHGVDAADRIDVDPLDAGGVHRHAADVAGELEPASVRGQVELLGDVGAVEAHGVGALLALDDVAAVARIPDEGVVAGAQLGQVVALVAERLRAGASEQGVVSFSAVDPRWDRVGEDAVALVDADEIVAGAHIDGDPRDVLALEAEVGRAVVPDVDLEDVTVARFEAKRELVARLCARDRQEAVAELRARSHCGPGRRDRVKPAAESGEPCPVGLARPFVSGEVVEGVAVVGDLQSAVGATGGA